MDDLDFSLDGSSRVTHRIAHGVYRITHNRRLVGEELWGIFGLLSGGYRLMTEIDLTWPVQNQQRAQLDLDTNWKVQQLRVQLDLEGRRRSACYLFTDGEIEITVHEEPLRYAEAMRTTREAAAQPMAPKRVYANKLVCSPSTFLDYGSPLMNFAHLRRLSLGTGEQTQIHAVVVTQPLLEPLVLRQTYTYVRDEQLSTTIMPFMTAHRYMIEEHTLSQNQSAGPVTTLWTDQHKIVLKQEVLMGKDTHACEMVSYAWLSEQVA